jgi:hypothetical protein
MKPAKRKMNNSKKIPKSEVKVIFYFSKEIDLKSSRSPIVTPFYSLLKKNIHAKR